MSNTGKWILSIVIVALVAAYFWGVYYAGVTHNNILIGILIAPVLLGGLLGMITAVRLMME